MGGGEKSGLAFVEHILDLVETLRFLVGRPFHLVARTGGEEQQEGQGQSYHAVTNEKGPPGFPDGPFLML